MIRALCCLCLSCAALISAAAFDPTPATKPILYVVHSDSCPPCRIFDRTWTDQRSFRDALQDKFDVRELDWDVAGQKAWAIRLGADRLPTYFVVKDNRLIAKHVGFAPSRDPQAVAAAIVDLMQSLHVEWPRQRVRAEPSGETNRTNPETIEPKREAAEPKTVPPVAAPVPSGPTIDQGAREGITKLASETRELKDAQQKTQQAVQGLQSEVAEVRSQMSKSQQIISQQLKESHDTTRSEFSKITDRLKETIERTISQAAPANPSGGLSFPPVSPSVSGSDISTEMPTGPTSSKWLDVLKWAGKTALMIGAPEIALPASAGLTALGIAMTWLRRRRAARKGTASPAKESPPSSDAATSAEPAPAKDDFKIETLPLQHIDYTTCWAEHWRNQHADPATALRELELYVQAWNAVKSGVLLLPGIDNPEPVFAAVNRWVNRQVTDHAQKALTSENTNHKVFYAYTWKTATDYLREGTFRVWKPNPPAADAIDDWVAARLTEKLTQTTS